MKRCRFCEEDCLLILGVFKGYIFCECDFCHLVQVENPPSKEELVKFYNSEASYTKATPNDRAKRRYREEFTTAYRKIEKSSYRKPTRVLDVGCSTGDWLREAQECSQGRIYCYGIDVDSSAIEVAKQNVPSGNFVVGNIYNEFKDIKFDIIMIGDVVEHVLDPHKLLSFLYSEKLAPGGVLIIKTPNYGSLGRRLLGISKWYYTDPPRHLQLFTLSFLKNKVFAGEVFKSKTTFSHVNIARFFGKKPSNHRAEIRATGKTSMGNKVKYLLFDLLNLFAFNFGGSMTIYVYKNSNVK